MTMHHTIQRTRSGGLLAAIRNLYDGVVVGYAMRNEYLRTIDELQRLSDRELEDIGVVRADIPGIAARRIAERRR